MITAIATNTEIIFLLFYHIQKNYENMHFQAQTYVDYCEVRQMLGHSSL